MSRKRTSLHVFDEVFTLLNLVAHKVRDRAISCKSTIDGYLKENAVLFIVAAQSRSGSISTKTLITLNSELSVVLKTSLFQEQVLSSV